MCKLRVSMMPQDCHKTFFNITTSLIEKSTDTKLLRTVTKIVDDWIRNRVLGYTWFNIFFSMIFPAMLAQLCVRSHCSSLAWWLSTRKDFLMIPSCCQCSWTPCCMPSSQCYMTCPLVVRSVSGTTISVKQNWQPNWSLPSFVDCATHKFK